MDIGWSELARYLAGAFALYLVLEGILPFLNPAAAQKLMAKLAQADPAQLRWQPSPTANSLGVIVVHLGLSERLRLRAIGAGERMDMAWRAHMFELPEGWGVEEAVAFYRAESARSDAVLDATATLDPPSRGDFRPTTFRWAVVHLIEETARHVGHMDITRELLDGRGGR